MKPRQPPGSNQALWSATGFALHTAATKEASAHQVAQGLVERFTGLPARPESHFEASIQHLAYPPTSCGGPMIYCYEYGRHVADLFRETHGHRPLAEIGALLSRDLFGPGKAKTTKEAIDALLQDN